MDRTNKEQQEVNLGLMSWKNEQTSYLTAVLEYMFKFVCFGYTLT